MRGGRRRGGWAAAWLAACAAWPAPLHSGCALAVRAARPAPGGVGVDVVLEMSGVAAAIHQAFDLVRVGGRVQMLGIPAKPMDVDFATEVIFKGITIYGVVGRRMYDTWHQMTRFLRSGKFDPRPAITHRFPLEGADEARSGE